ncbi:SDR family NAD(P)-dependent oxidoreductase [Phytohabitans kaempferiae]|uniref:SDR family NAD(P)-dependent oxidoreductase n=1 Tax=Phytohabitans kaempferiae TaxID=1620943 RepID=A0ABV6LZP3_9ACTN
MTTPLPDLLDLRGAHALVTGAARGIGRAVVARLLEAGARVTAVDLAQCPADLAGAALTWHRADVRDAAAAARIVDSAGGLSVLVNNAGVYPLAAWDDVDDDAWAAALDVNLTSAARYSRLAGDRMRRSGTAGAIVNVSSVAAVRPVPMLVPYGVAKAAVRQLTRALAVEYAPAGIRVNTVTPGGVRTEGAAVAREQARARPDAGFRTGAPPLGGPGTPDDAARAVLYFASPMSRYVTGAELVVDGGSLLS